MKHEMLCAWARPVEQEVTSQCHQLLLHRTKFIQHAGDAVKVDSYSRNLIGRCMSAMNHLFRLHCAVCLTIQCTDILSIMLDSWHQIVLFYDL